MDRLKTPTPNKTRPETAKQKHMVKAQTFPPTTPQGKDTDG
jgi:hypothetical protein